MAIAHYGTTTSGQTITTGGGDVTLTFSHDSGSGSDRILLLWATAQTNSTPKPTIDSATYNAIACTAMAASIGTAEGTSLARGFYLIAPATGSNTAGVVWGEPGAQKPAVMLAQTFTGVDQSTGVEGYQADSGYISGSPGDAPTVTVSSNTGDLVAGCATVQKTATWTAGSGQTERAEDTYSVSGDVSSCVSDEAGAASVAMDHESTVGGGYMCSLALSLIAAASGITVLRRRRSN